MPMWTVCAAEVVTVTVSSVVTGHFLFFVAVFSSRVGNYHRQTAEVETLRARLRHTERLHKEQMDVERRQRTVAAEETSAERR